MNTGPVTYRMVYAGATWEADVGDRGELIIYANTPATVAREFLTRWTQDGYGFR